MGTANQLFAQDRTDEAVKMAFEVIRNCPGCPEPYQLLRWGSSINFKFLDTVLAPSLVKMSTQKLYQLGHILIPCLLAVLCLESYNCRLKLLTWCFFSIILELYWKRFLIHLIAKIVNFKIRV
jgi:hypothetical protein